MFMCNLFFFFVLFCFVFFVNSVPWVLFGHEEFVCHVKPSYFAWDSLVLVVIPGDLTIVGGKKQTTETKMTGGSVVDKIGTKALIALIMHRAAH